MNGSWMRERSCFYATIREKTIPHCVTFILYMPSANTAVLSAHTTLAINQSGKVCMTRNVWMTKISGRCLMPLVNQVKKKMQRTLGQTMGKASSLVEWRQTPDSLYMIERQLLTLKERYDDERGRQDGSARYLLKIPELSTLAMVRKKPHVIERLECFLQIVRE